MPGLTSGESPVALRSCFQAPHRFGHGKNRMLHSLSDLAGSSCVLLQNLLFFSGPSTERTKVKGGRLPLSFLQMPLASNVELPRQEWGSGGGIPGLETIHLHGLVKSCAWDSIVQYRPWECLSCQLSRAQAALRCSCFCFQQK